MQIGGELSMHQTYEKYQIRQLKHSPPRINSDACHLFASVLSFEMSFTKFCFQLNYILFCNTAKGQPTQLTDCTVSIKRW